MLILSIEPWRTITLSTAFAIMQDPVVTPDGYLFSREAILENLLQQKKAIKRKLDAWEKSQQEEEEKVCQ